MSLRSARFLLCSFFLAVGLQAQVDPRLQAGLTDVLDVYTGGTAAKAPPEIITLIDNSGSMCAVYWSRYYYANADSTSSAGQTGQSWHADQWQSAGDFNNRLAAVVYTSGTGSSVKVWVSFHDAGSPIQHATPGSNSPISTLQNGVLIKPNGDPVVYADVNSTNPKLWIQRASHVRMAFTTVSSSTTYTYTGTGGVTFGPYSCNYLSNNARPRPFANGAYSGSPANLTTTDQIRVVDLPIPWAVFDAVPYYEGQNRTLSPAPTWPSSGNGGYSNAVANKHPQHTYIFDPVPDGAGVQTAKAQYYEVDALWSQGYGTLDGIMVPWTGATNAKGIIGLFQYNSDYLWWVAFGKDVRNQTGTGAYINGMVDAYSGSNAGGYSVLDARSGGAAWGNSLPGLTRLQAIKRCLVQTYVDNQQLVQWAIRFLYGDPQSTNGPTSFDSNNSDGNPGDRQLLVLNQPSSQNIPDVNLQYILTMMTNQSTPLTNAVMNCYAQFANTSNGNSKFNQTPPSCTQSFLIILSDGTPTDEGGTNDPYATGVTAGNTYVNQHPSYLSGSTGGSSNFNNFFTSSAIAAHYPSSSSITGMPTDTYNAVKATVPWVITSRPNGTTRRVSTMTIGVSMEGLLTDTYGAKKAMYAAALYGWEKRVTPWDINNNPPAPYDPTNSAANDKLKNPFFFDATDPDSLTSAMTTAFSLARTATNTMGAPVAPLVGLSVGNQTYVGTFITGQSSVWSGDLLMSGLSVSGSTIQVLDQNGAPIASTTGLNASNAAWSAANALATRGWKNRNIYTLTPTTAGSASSFKNDLLAWNESLSSSVITNAMLGVPDAATRQSLIRFMMGASTAAQNDPATTTAITTNRADMMGDIINSTPLIIGFPTTMVPSSSTILSNFVSNVGPSLSNLRFRLILVGDNQGLLHGFGEVSGIPSTTGIVAGRALTAGVVEGVVDELWAFLPPDVLSGLQTWRVGDVHRYFVDGSPTLYLNEQGTPNGIVDGTDYARVIFGLRKGGRSYYCLRFNGNDPNQPLIAWKVRPDEITASDVSVPNVTLKTMGFSSSTPTVARVTGSNGLTDVFLIGGGLSTLDVDSAFSVSTSANPPGYGVNTKLGRSVIALNVADGTVVTTWDFVNTAALKTAFPTMGCVPASVTPVEAIVNSFATQRVYFTDASGGAYVLGAMSSSGLRTDTNALSGWSVRHLYTPQYAGTAVSVPPVVFRLPYGYPVTRTTAPTAIVPAMGVVFGTGDRNDPMDVDTINPGGGGTSFSNRLIMILDRQDSADVSGALGKVDTFGFTDSDLADLTAITSSSGTAVDPSNSSYYLLTKCGYKLNYATGVAKASYVNAWQRYAYQKTVTPAIVLNKVLFFTNFQPITSSTSCTGSGNSNTYRMCDVINPVYGSGNVQATSSNCSGWYAQFNDIPSELASVGLAGVLQAGEVKNLGTGSGTIGTQPIPGNPPSNMPRPRSWRIVR